MGEYRELASEMKVISL